MKIYLVGGAVRDSLLNYPHKEKDWVVVGATPQQMLELGYQQVGKDFPVFLHPETKEEYALARTERKSAKGYTGFTVHASPDVTLEEDLLRRDLTINAIAQDDQGVIIDPYNGRADVENRILRHVSDAFVEDPLRVVRVARFVARYHHLGFTVAKETMQLMQDIVKSGEIEALVAERVWTETEKALSEKNPQRYFEVLRECGALQIIMPEVDNLFGVPQPEIYHPEIDTGIHTMMCLYQSARLNTDIDTRFAVLTHDLGKGTTPAEILPSHQGHEMRSVELIEKMDKRMRLPKAFKQLATLIAKYHTHVHRAAELKASTMLEVIEASDAYRRPERFEKLLQACECDARGRTGYEDTPYPQADLFRQALVASKEIAMQELVEKFERDVLPDKIRAARISAIKTALNK